MFWTVFVRKRHGPGVIRFGAGEAALLIDNIPVTDWFTVGNSLNPAHPMGSAPASVSIEVLWYGAGAASSFSNAVNAFRGVYRQTKAVVAAVANTPSANFQLVTNPTSISAGPPGLFAQIGREGNGFFFTQECEELDEEEDED